MILVEPLFHAGAEAQAIGRVDRIGQTKPTFVHRFLVADTIEEAVQRRTKSSASHMPKQV